MNLQQYATIYGNFHGAYEYDVIGETIIIPLFDESWSKSIVLKLKNFNKIHNGNSKMLVRSLMYHFQKETICTVFTTNNSSWSVLLGDQKMIFPKGDGKTFLCATPYFVQNPKNFTLDINYYDNVYSYKNAIIYLDDCDIPYPGGSYFENNTGNSLYRICILTLDQSVVETFEREFLPNQKNILKIPLKIKHVEANVSSFIEQNVVNRISFPENFYESTNVILKRKCFRDPDFILQDVLNSVHLENVGIVIEYPICISYLATNKNNHSNFKAFAINCHLPKTILYVPAPYDRYYQYKHSPKSLNWTTLLYDEIASPLESVVFNKNIVGYVYKETFFCLTHPKLLRGTFAKNTNLKYLLNMLTFDLKQDENFKVVNSYRYDLEHSVICVKHKDLPNELWCMALSSHHTSYVKRIIFPYLVDNWCRFLLEHAENKNANYGDLNLVKLSFVLATHKICFATRPSNKRDIVYENYKDIIFKLEPEVIDFINDKRLNLLVPAAAAAAESCSIL